MLHPEGDEMDYDVIVIGAGAGGEAAGNLGGELGGRVAVVERDLVGGECGFWACMPSKSLLDTAARHAAGTKGFDWQHASDRRDYMISREGIDYPNDAGHVAALEASGAEVIRGEARIVGKGRVEVRLNGGGAPRTLEASNLIVSSGSVPFVPPLEGLEEAGYWTNREATALRDLPSSIVVLGGGPIGVELAQVYIRFGVKTVLVESNDRLLPRDHPLSSRTRRAPAPGGASGHPDRGEGDAGSNGRRGTDRGALGRLERGGSGAVGRGRTAAIGSAGDGDRGSRRRA